jgi:hypothetical protein
LFHLFEVQCGNANNCKTKELKLTTDRKLKKTLSNLKEQDPILYNFKKLYKTENIYSKICQKPHQPMLINKQGYNALQGDFKKNAVKYWNFTTQQDAYYSCPNAKFPYLNFMIKKHPKDYCIPCCIKTQSNKSVKEAKRLIYDICLKTHKYTKEARTVTLGSRYIMSYGKDVEPGRLSRLPENSLEPLFYETYSAKNTGVDQECISNDGYYLYGVDQHYKNINNVGILNILVHTTETNVYDFITNIIKLIKANTNKFRVLLDGNINKYFKNFADFNTSMYNNFVSNNSIITDQIIPWNVIFINLAYLFLNINIVYFNHNADGSIKLVLPSYITNKEQFVSNNFTNILILQKKTKYYPIYLLNTNVFFKARLFTKKIFLFNDPIMTIVSKLVQIHFNENVKNTIKNSITLMIIQDFIKENNYTLHKLYVNNSNMCYYIHIKSKSGENIYLPVELSHFIDNSNISITYDIFLRSKNRMKLDVLLSLIKKLNNWIAIKSEKEGMLIAGADKNLPLESRVQPIYPYIKIINWIVLSKITTDTKNSPVIGFMFNNINYYFDDIKIEHVLKVKKAPMVQVLYDPDEINKAIFEKSGNISDTRQKLAGKSIYNNNLYKLLLLEFMYIFNGQRNIKLRQKIKTKLLGNFNKDFDELMEEVSKLIVDCDDYNKIKTQICEFINNHHSKNLLFQEIDDSFYTFDRETFDNIKTMTKEKITKELEKISQKFVVYGDVSKIKDFNFPNMFVPCQIKNNSYDLQYCKKNKFIIDKTQLKKILEIITSDILNPVKEKWLFSSIMSDNVINLLRFIRRPNETITIEFVD